MESFFGFKTDSPTLGSGKVGMADHMFDQREDEIDMMNNETFGDAALCGSDWEEHHEKLAVELETWAPGSELQDYHNGYGQHLARNGADSRGESPENDLEHSINQLVVDDEEEENSHGRPIPGRRLPVDLENLIGAASPPSLYGTDDMVAGHPNIWGSPTTTQASVDRQEQGLKMLLKQLQSKDSIQQIPIGRTGYSTGAVPGPRLPQSLPEAMTLEELEGRIGIPQKKALTLEELEKQLTTPVPPVPRPGMPTPGERVPSPVQQGLPLPIGTPPQKSFIQQHGGQKRVSPLSMQTVPENLKGQQQQLLNLLAYNRSRNLASGVVPTTSTSTNYPSTIHLQPKQNPSTQPVTSPAVSSNTELRMVQALVSEHSPPQQVAMGLLQEGSDRGEHRRDSSGLGKSPVDRVSPLQQKNTTTTPTQQRIPPHSHLSDPSHSRSGQRSSYHHGNQGFSRQSLFHDKDHRDGNRHDNRGYHGRGRGYHQGGEWGGSYQNGDRGHYHRNNDRAGYSGDRDFRNNRGHYHKQDNRHHMGPYGDMDEDFETGDPGDEYAGLMSKKEKDWIIKIQLMQLQTDNPYLDDYYYTMWQLKKLQAEVMQKEEEEGKGPALVLPQLAGRIEFKPYMPIQFDNALGKLTAASVHNPRQIIDVKRDSTSDKDDVKGREVQRFKQLQLDIEQAYDLLLIIDDMEKQAMALPEESRPAVLESRKEAVRSLYLGMRVIELENDFFRRVINIRKGVKLIARLLLMVQQAEAVYITIHLFKYLSDLSKKSWQKDVLPQLLVSVKQSIWMSKLEDIVKYAKMLSHTTSVIDTALQNQFGWCVMWSLLQRGESIYTEMSPLDMDVSDQKQWCEFVEQVAESLSGLPTTSEIEIPHIYRKAVQDHFSRLLDRNLYLSIEDHLQSLCNPQIS